MRSYPECIPCIVEQTLRATKRLTENQQLHLDCLYDVCANFRKNRPLDNPARESQFAYETVMNHTGAADPYRDEMLWANKLAKEILSNLPHDSHYFTDMEAALRLSAAGNAIDYGPQHSSDIEQDVRDSIEQEPAVSHFSDFAEKLNNAENLLFLADNAGEIIFDKVFLSLIKDKGINVTIAVKSGPILNDVTLKTAREIGLDNDFPVIGTGSNAMGVDFWRCSDEFLELFKTSDIILAKGQANFESLHGTEREIFSLLRVKCPIIASLTGGPVGRSVFLSLKRLEQSSLL